MGELHNMPTYTLPQSVAMLAGAGLYPQDGSGIDGSTRSVVASTAIEDDNPDLLAARRYGIPLRHRAAPTCCWPTRTKVRC